MEIVVRQLLNAYTEKVIKVSARVMADGSLLILGSKNWEMLTYLLIMTRCWKIQRISCKELYVNLTVYVKKEKLIP